MRKNIYFRIAVIAGLVFVAAGLADIVLYHKYPGAIAPAPRVFTDQSGLSVTYPADVTLASGTEPYIGGIDVTPSAAFVFATSTFANTNLDSAEIELATASSCATFTGMRQLASSQPKELNGFQFVTTGDAAMGGRREADDIYFRPRGSECVVIALRTRYTDLETLRQLMPEQDFNERYGSTTQFDKPFFSGQLDAMVASASF